MKTVKEALASLKETQRKLIMDSFNEVEPLTLFLDEGIFLCVHVQPTESPGEIIQHSGFWLLGKILKHAQER